MALETLTVQETSRETGAGAEEIDVQNVTIAGGFQFLNDGKTLLVVVNAAAPTTLAFTIQQTIDGEAVATKDVVVATSETWVMGPFPTRIYNNANGYCFCTPTADLGGATGVAPIKMGG